MKTHILDLFNRALEDYQFNQELNGESETAFKVLTSVAIHLHGVAFCLESRTAMQSLQPAILKLQRGEVPAPILS